MISAGSYFLAYLFEALTNYMYFNNKFNQKVSNKILFSAFTLSLAIQYGCNFFGIPSVNLINFFICNLLLCFLCYDTKLKSSVFNSVILTSLMLITELVIMYISTLLFGIEVTTHRTDDLVLFTQISSIKLLYLFVTYIISKLTTKESRKTISHTRSTLLLILPIASILLLTGMVKITGLYNTHSSVYYIFFISTILLLYSNITVFWVHESLTKALQENMEYRLEKQKSTINAEHYEILQNQYESSSILVHDIKRHLLSIKDFATEKDCDSIIRYIDDLYEGYQITHLKKYSDHKLINAIVTRYAEVCRISGIDFFCDIRSVDLSFVPDDKLTSIFDNILENAVENSKDSVSKKIDLTVNEANKNFVVITAENTCSQKPIKRNGELISTKKQSGLHGFGIKSIKRIAKEYNGKVDFSFDDEQMIFSITVALMVK